MIPVSYPILFQDSARRIAKVSAEAKLPVEEEQYVQSFRPHLMDVVHLWTQGAQFSQICKMTDAFEGSIIRCIRRLEELMRQMCQAAKAIGNTELEKKFAEGEPVMWILINPSIQQSHRILGALKIQPLYIAIFCV